MRYRTSSDLKQVLVMAALLGMTSNALPCGDKLMVVTRGQRTAAGHNAPHRGAILLYATPGSAVASALTGANLKKSLERAGHRVRTVSTRADLKSAIGGGSYDVVLADFKALAEVEADTRAGVSAPTIIPTLFDPSPDELASARSDLRCVVKSKGAKADYLTVVNDVLTARAKVEGARKGSKKS